MLFSNTFGSGTPVLLIHGFCESSVIWANLQSKLSIDYQVITIDLPGFGRSTLSDSLHSLNDVADEISHFLVSKKISSCFVIGHSLGGYVALALAQNNPEIVLGFGLFHSTTFPDDAEKRKTRDKIVKHVQNYGLEAWTNGFIQNLFHSEAHNKHKESIETLKQIASQTSIDTFSAYSEFMKNRIDSNRLLTSFQKPVFIIAGEQDIAVPLKQALDIRDQIVNGDSLILKKTGHMGFIEREKECTSFIKSFLKKNLK
jgi:pimeloyl-ACP methyl ester carboxylesterase